MAHELEIINGEAQMAYVGDLPWHGLGVQVPEDIAPMDMMTVAGLDWRVEEVESFVEFDGRKIPTGQKALVRDVDGRVLTQVGKNWHPCQNHEAFNFFNDFIEAGNMKMHTAGSLKDGEIIWALAKVEDDFELFNGDKVESYMLFSNPHQYGKTIDIRFTPIRVVCNNTLTLSLNTKSESAVKVNHRSAFDAEKVKETMGIAHFKMGQYKEMAEFLGNKRATDDAVNKYFGHLFGRSTKNEEELSRTGKRAVEILHTQPGANFAEGSWWQAFNAVTYLTDHELGRSNDTRLQSAWYGANRTLKNKALETALEMAEAA